MAILRFFSVSIFLLYASGTWAFPTSYTGISVKEIQMWPGSVNQEHSYTVTLESSLKNSDNSIIACPNPGIFAVEAGDYHDQTLSVLLAAQMANKKINILVISTSEIKISVIIDEDKTLNAVKKLHTIFDLD